MKPSGRPPTEHERAHLRAVRDTRRAWDALLRLQMQQDRLMTERAGYDIDRETGEILDPEPGDLARDLFDCGLQREGWQRRWRNLREVLDQLAREIRTAQEHLAALDEDCACRRAAADRGMEEIVL